MTETWNPVGSIRGADGGPGPSAYQIAVTYGFGGTEEEWLESLSTGGYNDAPVRALIATEATARGTRDSELTGLVNGKADTAHTHGQYQTASQVDARVQQVVGAAPAALDTLAEIADRLEDDSDAVAALTAELATKATTASVTAGLAAKAPTAHTHAIADVTGLAAALAARPVRTTINAQTGTAYAASLTDEGRMVTLTNAAAIAVTLPLLFPEGGRIDFAVLGAGMATFSAEAGGSVVGTPSLATRAIGSAVSAFRLPSDVWLLVGDLA